MQIESRRPRVVERRRELGGNEAEPSPRLARDHAPRGAPEADVLFRLVPNRATCVGDLERREGASRVLGRADEQVPPAVEADERALTHAYAVSDRPGGTNGERERGGKRRAPQTQRERRAARGREHAESRREHERLRSNERR